MLAGCTSGNDSNPAPSNTTTEPTAGAPTPAPSEGPATEPITYPDGMSMRLVKLEKADRKLGVDVPGDQTIVRVTAAFTNSGTTPIPFDPDSRYITVYHGEGRTEASPVTGYDYPDKARQLRSIDPTRIMPGRTIEVVRSQLAPTAEVGALSVEVECPQNGSTPRQPYMFTGAEALLK